MKNEISISASQVRSLRILVGDLPMSALGPGVAFRREFAQYQDDLFFLSRDTDLLVGDGGAVAYQLTEEGRAFLASL